MRIEVDLLKCESNGMCVAQAPGWFELDDDDVLTVRTDPVSDADVVQVQAAVRMCPKQALSLID